MDILESLGALVLQYPAWAHVIIGAAVLLQGELAILFSMLLIVNGELSWGAFLASTLSALIVGETVAYYIGRTLRTTRFGWKLYRNKIKPNRRYQPYFYYLTTNLTKLLIASKFLVGANLFVLLLVGWTRITFGKFFKSYLSGLILWFGSMTAIAYFLVSGLNYLKTAQIFKQAEYGIILIFVIIFAFEFLLKKFVQKGMPFKGKSEDIGSFLEDEELPEAAKQ